jgi:hypothetical protein
MVDCPIKATIKSMSTQIHHSAWKVRARVRGSSGVPTVDAKTYGMSIHVRRR